MLPALLTLAAGLLAVTGIPLTDFEAALPLTVDGEGIQPGSAAALSTEHAHSGKQAVRLDYVFIEQPKGLQYVGFHAPLTIPVRLGEFRVWAYGDGSKQPVRVRLIDRTGEVHQFDLGSLSFTGWRELRTRIGDHGSHWGGDNNGLLDPPIQFGSVLIDSAVRPAKGSVWFDDLSWLPETTADPAWSLPVALPGAADGVLAVPVGGRVALDTPVPPGATLAVGAEGDGRAARLSFEVTDAAGPHEVPYGPVLWQGWLRATARVPAELKPPLRLTGLTVAGEGGLRLRELSLVPEHGAPQPMRMALTDFSTAPGLGGERLPQGNQVVVDPQVRYQGSPSWRLDYQFAELQGIQYAELNVPLNLGRNPRPLHVWVKGDGQGNALRLRATDASGEYHQFNLGDLGKLDDWREFTCDFTAPHGTWFGDKNGKIDGDLRLVSLLVDAVKRPSAGSLWFAGATTEVMAPAAEGVGCTLQAEGDGPIHVGAGPYRVRLGLNWRRLDAPAPARLPVDLVVEQPGGGVKRQRVEAPVGGAPEVIDVPAAGLGLARVTAVWRVADDYGVRELPLARLPEVPEQGAATNPFGACLHFHQGKHRLPQTYDLLREGGLRWSRDEYTWDVVEPTPGKYVFPTRHDAFLRAARPHGIEPLFILDYGNANYDGGNSPTSDAAQDAFAAYCYQLVNHNKDYCRTWEIYNEPNISFWKPKPDPVAYTRLLKKAYAACKRADPNCVVLGICTAGIDFTYIETVLQNGGGAAMDALSVHPYRYPTSPEASNFVGDLDRLHALMVKYGIGDKPVWITEIGWPNQQDARGSTERQSADYLVRMVSLARSRPYMGPVIWYDFQDDADDPAYNEANFGLIRRDEAPKEPYVAAAMMGRAIAGLRFAADRQAPSPAYVHEYAGEGGRRALVLWSTPVACRVTLSLDAREVEVSDVTGAIRTERPRDGKLTLEIGEQPVFVTGRFASPACTVAPE